MTDTPLEERPIPTDSRCPYCGGEPRDDDTVEHRLSALGYLHDDTKLQCQDCNKAWVCGRPIGSSDEFADDLWCQSCRSCFYRVHRVEAPDNGVVHLHLKCPNDECNYFDKTQRRLDENGRALVGFPDITGDTRSSNVQPYGYERDGDGESE